MNAPLPPAYQRHFDWLRYAGIVAVVVFALLGLWTVASLFFALQRIFSH